MAAPTNARPPSLPSSSDPVPYVPVSWMAVGALAVAVVYLLLLLALGWDAYRTKRPLLVEAILVLPVVAVVLSFAARRMIRNSEGTRAGEGLANAAWWIAVVGGMGYLTYLFAIDLKVRGDATREVERWAKFVADGDVPQAFWYTIEPGRRSAIDRKDGDQMEKLRRAEYVGFRQSDLVQLADRNPGACRFEPGTLQDWKQEGPTISCAVTGVVVCPEGRHKVVVPLRGFEGVVADGVAQGRQWMIRNEPGGFVRWGGGEDGGEKTELSPYGWLVLDLREQGARAGREFTGAAGIPGFQLLAYLQFVRPDGNPLTAARFAAVGGAGMMAAMPGQQAEYAAYAESRLFGPPAARDPANPAALKTDPPTAANREKFRVIWNAGGLRMPKNDSPDKYPTMFLSDTAVEVRVPVELQLPGAGGSDDVARGRVVVACTDPGLLAELKAMREVSRGAALTEKPPAGFGGKAFPWRVVRVESDLKPVPQMRPGDMPPG